MNAEALAEHRRAVEEAEEQKRQFEAEMRDKEERARKETELNIKRAQAAYKPPERPKFIVAKAKMVRTCRFFFVFLSPFFSSFLLFFSFLFVLLCISRTSDGHGASLLSCPGIEAPHQCLSSLEGCTLYPCVPFPIYADNWLYVCNSG